MWNTHPCDEETSHSLDPPITSGSLFDWEAAKGCDLRTNSDAAREEAEWSLLPYDSRKPSALGPADTLSERRRGWSNAAVTHTDPAHILRVSFKDLILLLLSLAKAVTVWRLWVLAFFTLHMYFSTISTRIGSWSHRPRSLSWEIARIQRGRAAPRGRRAQWRSAI